MVSLYVCDLPDQVEKDEVINLFSEFGGFIECRVVRDKNREKIAFVDFESKDQAKFAIDQLSGYRFIGSTRGVSIRFSEHSRGIQQKLEKKYHPYKHSESSYSRDSRHRANHYRKSESDSRSSSDSRGNSNPSGKSNSPSIAEANSNSNPLQNISAPSITPNLLDILSMVQQQTNSNLPSQPNPVASLITPQLHNHGEIPQQPNSNLNSDLLFNLLSTIQTPSNPPPLHSVHPPGNIAKPPKEIKQSSSGSVIRSKNSGSPSNTRPDSPGRGNYGCYDQKFTPPISQINRYSPSNTTEDELYKRPVTKFNKTEEKQGSGNFSSEEAKNIDLGSGLGGQGSFNSYVIHNLSRYYNLLYNLVKIPKNATSTVYVEGIPPDATEREVAHIFRPFPGFRCVRLIPRKTKNGEKVIFCFADFENPLQTTLVINTLQGYRFDKDDILGLLFSYATHKS